MNIVTKRELVRDTVEAFGHREAAELMGVKKVPFSHFYWMCFGRAPRQLAAPPTPAAERIREVLHREARTHIGRIAR